MPSLLTGERREAHAFVDVRVMARHVIVGSTRVAKATLIGCEFSARKDIMIFSHG